MRRAEVLIYDGFDELDAVAPFEILAAAGFEVRLVTAERTREVRTAHGMSLLPHGELGDAPGLLVVPGGGWVAKAPAGAWAEVRRGVLPELIAERRAAGTAIAGVCSGAMLLAASGMLRGRPAVTHRGALEDLRASGAEVHPEARVVDDGDVLTCGGVSAALDLALHVVARERGEDAASAAAQRIEHERVGPVMVSEPGASGGQDRPNMRS
jgi:transcriptional regulator GlxA family with amidase domain